MKKLADSYEHPRNVEALKIYYQEKYLPFTATMEGVVNLYKKYFSGFKNQIFTTTRF